MQKNNSISIFSLKYWKLAVLEIKNIRSLTFASIMIALTIINGSLFIPVGENLRIKFSFLAIALGSLVCGPVISIFIGGISDLLGFLIVPSGIFFPGYTLSAILGALIFALFLYQKHITILRIFFAKFIVNYIVNVGLGSIWSSMLFGKGYLYYFSKSIIKNTIMLPIEVIMLALLIKILMPTLIHTYVIPNKKTNKFLSFKISNIIIREKRPFK